MMKIIVAVGLNQEIGYKGELLWNIPADMKQFKEKTLNHTVIMGRKTWESIPKKYRPLEKRENIVISRNKDYKAEGAIVCNSLEEATKFAHNDIFVIGGGEIYKEAIEVVDELYVTHIYREFTADSYFPTIDYKKWAMVSLEPGAKENDKFNYFYAIYKRR